MDNSTSIGTGAKKTMFGRENQRAATAGCANGVQRLTIAIIASTDHCHWLREYFHAVLQRALGFHDQPGRAEQRIGHNKPETRERD